MKYLTCMGEIYRLTNKLYLDFLRARISGQDYDLDKYGQLVGPYKDVTDLSKEEAEWLLEVESKRAK